MTIHGPTRQLVKEAFFKVVDKSDENQTGVDWLELAEPFFWRGEVPGTFRNAEGWLPGSPLPVVGTSYVLGCRR